LQFGESVRAAVESAGLSFQNINLFPTISIGVAEFTRTQANFEELMRIADDALYRAKAAGKNCVRT
jgi:diguanylate cyclase (GGDEF)-like protein